MPLWVEIAMQRTRIKEDVAKHSNHVEHKEDIEVAESNRLQRPRTELCKDEVEYPVGKRSSRIAESTDFDGEDFCRIHPGDDTERGVEEGEDKVHGDHGAKHVSVIGVEGLGHGGVTDESGSKTGGGDDERLDTTEAFECPEANGTVDDGKRSADTDNHERSRIVDTQDLVDLRTYQPISLLFRDLIKEYTCHSS